MGLRFRKVFRLGSLFRVNVSKSGLSTSVGRSPFTVNVNGERTKVTTSLPGTGLSYQTQVSRKQVPLSGVVIVAVVMIILYFALFN